MALATKNLSTQKQGKEESTSKLQPRGADDIIDQQKYSAEQRKKRQLHQTKLVAKRIKAASQKSGGEDRKPINLGPLEADVAQQAKEEGGGKQNISSLSGISGGTPDKDEEETENAPENIPQNNNQSTQKSPTQKPEEQSQPLTNQESGEEKGEEKSSTEPEAKEAEQSDNQEKQEPEEAQPGSQSSQGNLTQDQANQPDKKNQPGKQQGADPSKQNASPENQEAEAERGLRKGKRTSAEAGDKAKAKSEKEEGAAQKAIGQAKKSSQKGTGKILQQAWLNLIDSWGLTYLYIVFHFLNRYLTPWGDFFCRFGHEWLPEMSPPASKTLTTKKEDGTGWMPNSYYDSGEDAIKGCAELTEIMSCIGIGLLILILILIAFLLMSMIAYVFEHPFKTAAGIGWEAVKNLVGGR